ncbi:uncharacterized protein LOC110027686 [Phalaenopsis equestris]|uniref:uncharacterized protein LOC110027686 n=1 Tax=Phalaenopsis equestris TaxID=78828 RepID=UPI0009E374A7|nr:uncharacterized protein LOC110027686 [Phalaenopsis equestris]
MRAEARLDSAVFQLTPTRTRCDLVIIANGKTEKVASGLLNPFVSHLKTAQDQIAKGGYSIKLEPDPESEAPWFTKGTVERFVRFVSTPEVLERVHTIESEILQIEKSISSQENDNLGLKTVEDPLTSSSNSEGNIQMHGADNEKAIVPYKTGNLSKPSVSNESKLHEESSKVQLVRVLENRKKVLQKEQAMVFACTAAAGFEMESMAHLLSFAESFGASRLREACSQYMQLWVEKHESGLWIEIEGAETLSYRSEFPPMNASGIIFSEDAVKQKKSIEAWPASAGDVGMEKNNGNATSLENDRDESLSSERPAPHGQPVYQGQFPYPPFPQWPPHSQANPYLSQPYPMQAMPYYQNYPAEAQFLHPPYSPMEDSKLNTHQSKGKKQYSMHSKDSSSHSEDGTDQNTSEFDEEPLGVRKSHRKSGHSGKKNGLVVIRNLNYIAKRQQSTSENKSEFSSDSEIDYIRGMLSGSVKREDNNQESTKISNMHGNEEELYKQEEDAGNWQAFQSFLMEAEEKMSSAVDGNIFAGEKEHSVKELQNKDGPDPILLSTRDSVNYQEESTMEYDAFCGEGSRTKLTVSTDEFLVAAEGQVRLNSLADAQFKEMDEGVSEYRKVSSDDFIMRGLEKLVPNKIFSDPLADFENESGTKLEKSFSPIIADESFVIPFRFGTLDQRGVDTRIAIDMAAEFQSAPSKEEESSSKATTRVNCEPDDLTLILEHRRESDSVGYNQIVDFDIQVPLFVKQEIKKEEDYVSESINDSKIDVVKLKSPQSELEKKRKDTILRRATSTRSTPQSEAQKRAEKLRSYKSDLQKLKKEHEEQEIRRLEALKRERQERIASRNGSKAVQSSSNQQQFNTEKTSKFKISENGSNLPLHKLPTPNVANRDVKTKTTRSNRSMSELKESAKQERNSVSARIRRLSEPNGRGVHNVPEKSANTNTAIKMALAETKKITADRTSTDVPQNATIGTGFAASHASFSPIGTVDRENQAEANQTDPINSFENVTDLRSSHQIYETEEKPQNQMGLRKLWKFGRNGHNSHVEDGNLHSYESVADDATAATPNDISRPFSTLSPFHGRSNEKKIVASA